MVLYVCRQAIFSSLTPQQRAAVAKWLQRCNYGPGTAHLHHPSLALSTLCPVNTFARLEAVLQHVLQLLWTTLLSNTSIT